MENTNFNRRILMIIGGLLLAGLLYFAYAQYLNFRYVESELNNRYENSFQNVNHHLDSLEREMGMVLLSSTDDNLSTNLSQTWRSAYAAHEGIGEIPIGSDTLNNTKRLLDKIIWYSRHLDDDLDEKDSLKPEEIKVVQELKQSVGGINEALEELDNKMKQENFRWNNKKRVDLDLDEKEYEGTSLLAMVNLDDGLDLAGIREEFKKVNIEIDNFVGQASNAWGSFELVADNFIDDEEALASAKDFIEAYNEEEYKYEIVEADKTVVQGEEVDNEMPAFAIEAINLDNRNEVIYLDVSKEKGKIMNYLKRRMIGEKQLEEATAIENIGEMLQDAGYENLELIDIEEYGNVLVLSLAPEYNDVMVRSNKVQVEIALDDGEVLAFDGSQYFLHASDRELNFEELEAELIQEEAKEKVSDLLTINREQKVVREDKWGNKVLCYEFTGHLKEDDQNEYIIRINANSGKEEEIRSRKRDII